VIPAAVMQKWIEGAVTAQTRWTERLFSLKVEADISFEAGQFAKLALAVESEMLARPYSFVNAPDERPHEFYYVTLPDGPLTQRLCKLKAGDGVYLAPRPAGFLALSEVPEGENLWLIATGTGIGPFLSILKTEAPWRRFKQVVLIHAVGRSEELTHRRASSSCCAGAASKCAWCPWSAGKRQPAPCRGVSPRPSRRGGSRRRRASRFRRTRLRL